MTPLCYSEFALSEEVMTLLGFLAMLYGVLALGLYALGY